MRCKTARRLMWNWYTVQTAAAKAAYEKHLRGCAECHPLIETPNLEWVYDDDAIAAAAAACGVDL